MTTTTPRPAANRSTAVAAACGAIVERLRILHPSLDEAEIRLIVAEAAHRFDEVRLPQFTPLLIEKVARDECRKRTRSEAPDLERASHSAAVLEIHD